MRSIRIDASARHSTGVVAPPARVSSGTSLTAMSEFSCILPDISHPTSYLPSHQSGFASRSSPLKSGIGAMKVLTPAALTPHGGSLRLLCLVFRTSNPQPRYGPEHRFRSRLNALGGSCDPGFAMNEQARRTMPPKRVRHPVRSLPAALHPALLRRSYLQLHVLRLHIGRTFTLLTRQHHRRTHSRESGNPEPRHARPSLDARFRGHDTDVSE